MKDTILEYHMRHYRFNALKFDVVGFFLLFFCSLFFSVRRQSLQSVSFCSHVLSAFICRINMIRMWWIASRPLASDPQVTSWRRSIRCHGRPAVRGRSARWAGTTSLPHRRYSGCRRRPCTCCTWMMTSSWSRWSTSATTVAYCSFSWCNVNQRR